MVVGENQGLSTEEAGAVEVAAAQACAGGS